MNYTLESLRKLRQKSVAGFKTTKGLLAKLSRTNSKKLDELMLAYHSSEFEKINCLECANCCKSISPAIYDTDIRRMARALKMTPSAFTVAYLQPDDDGSYIFKVTPCLFLDSSNYCKIYDDRPKACREYPHTDRKRFYQILNITAQNSKICPAVFNIIERIRSTLNKIQ